MNEDHLVSVIIPTYRRSDYLLQTIDSVINQTYSNIEIIIVDDNGLGSEFQRSTHDKLKKYIESGQIIYIPHEFNRNGSAARNTGFKASRGKYINFLDDDDELLPEKISKQVQILEESSSDYGAVYCNTVIKRYRGGGNNICKSVSTYTQEGCVLEDYLMTRCCFGTSSILLRREAVDFLGGFDESYVRHQDLEFVTRFFQHYKIKVAGKEPLMVFDLTKDRSNSPKPKNEFIIKEKYLLQFSPYFSKIGIEEIVNHHFWFNCGLNAIVVRDWSVALKSLRRSRTYGYFNVREYNLIIRRILSSIYRCCIHK